MKMRLQLADGQREYSDFYSIQFQVSLSAKRLTKVGVANTPPLLALRIAPSHYSLATGAFSWGKSPCHRPVAVLTASWKCQVLNERNFTSQTHYF